MFKVLILVCSVSVSPADCQINTALDVITGPEASNEIQCGLFGQAFYAETAMGGQQRADEYLKVKCTRTTIGTTVG